jgi:serine-type D-Ala-D-Ala carboxypeptidase/endopeptidase (penicillin-binding protein 4)
MLKSKWIENISSMLNKTILLILFFSVNLFPQTGLTKLKSELNSIVKDEFFNQSQVAIDIYDLTEGKYLFSHNNKLLLHPASNMKLFTTAAGLIFLGPDYFFTTSLYYKGIVEGVTLYGDLYIVGGLDPDFSTDDLDTLVQAVKSMEIRFITENLYADVSIKDSLYWGKGWMWDDNPDPGAPYLSSVNINSNSIKVFIDGNKTGLPGIVKLFPKTKYAEVKNLSKSVPSTVPGRLKITRDWINNKNTIIIEGTVRSGEIIDSSTHTGRLNLIEPEKYFLTLFKEHLEKEKIYAYGELERKQLPNGSIYLASINRPLAAVLPNLNKESDNLSAEMLLYALALKDSGAPAVARNGIGAIYNLIDSIGLNPNDYFIADGSGISRYNLVSAELLTGLLKYMYHSPEFFIYYNSLSVAGVDGTLKNRMKNTIAEGNVHAKTGTLAGVSALSGYVTAKNGNIIAFSILMQNFVDKTSVARSFQDWICVLLANYE